MFWQTFRRLCVEADQTTEKAARGIGVRRETLNGWRHGAMPQERTLRKIADYFGLSMDDIMLEVDRDLPEGPGEFPLSELEVRIIRATRRLSPEQQDFLMEMLESAVRRILIKSDGAVSKSESPSDE